MEIKPIIGFKGLTITFFVSAILTLTSIILVYFPYLVFWLRNMLSQVLSIAGIGLLILTLVFLWIVSKEEGWQILKKIFVYRVCALILSLVNTYVISLVLFPLIPSNIYMIVSSLNITTVGIVNAIIGIKAWYLLLELCKSWSPTPVADLGVNFSKLFIVGGFVSIPGLMMSFIYQSILQIIINAGNLEFPVQLLYILSIAGAFSIAHNGLIICASFMAAKFFNIVKHPEHETEKEITMEQSVP